MAVKILELNSTISFESINQNLMDSSPPVPSPGAHITYVDFYLHDSFVSLIFIVSYLLIFMVCMVGNGLVCFIVLRSKHMRTVTNLFILNLAISDLLVGFFCMPTTLVDNIITGWPFGSLVCKLSGMVQGISVSASVFTLVAIAVDRFRCIVYPFKQKLTISTSTITIAVIWVLAISIMCPSGFMLQVTEERQISILLGNGNSTQSFYWCHENWPNKKMRKIYTTVLFANIYIGPLTLIVIMYARIGLTLLKTATPTHASQDSASSVGSDFKNTGGYETRQIASQKKKRVLKMLLLVALLFILSWLPLWTLMMLSDYASLNEFQHRVINIYIYPLAHWLAFSNSSINPIIYGFFNENFRRGFQAAFKLQLFSLDHNRSRIYLHCVQENVVQTKNTNLAPGPVSGGEGPSQGMVISKTLKKSNEKSLGKNRQFSRKPNLKGQKNQEKFSIIKE
ncbi:neuropeptide FF receptor 2 [Silurus asotus]|uniref:Neuropeptide FF receptor 1 n=1 Tax=Silurus asotus TaxID=30991 RepID=A0AAD5FFY5_SILAS|nr:neuropeptide FF receptor 2 [Silurus asotus]